MLRPPAQEQDVGEFPYPPSGPSRTGNANRLYAPVAFGPVQSTARYALKFGESENFGGWNRFADKRSVIVASTPLYKSSYGTFWRQPKTLGHFGTLLSPSQTGEMPCIQHSHVGAIIAHCHCGPPWEALVVSWLAVEGDRYIALFEPVTLFLLAGARPSLQQPLFRSQQRRRFLALKTRASESPPDAFPTPCSSFFNLLLIGTCLFPARSTTQPFRSLLIPAFVPALSGRFRV
jgi:hypothetical protein